MGLIDIIVISLILLAGLYGFFRGFSKQIFSLVSSFFSLIASYLLIEPFTKLLSKIGLDAHIYNVINEWVLNKSPMLNYNVNPATINGPFESAVSELGVPGFISKLIAKYMNFDGVTAEVTMDQLVSQKVSYVILSIIAFVILIIIIKLGLFVLEKLCDILVTKTSLRLVDRLLGVVLSEIKIVLVISVAMLILGVFASMFLDVNNFIISDMNIGTESFSIAKLFYEHNPLLWVFNNVL